MVKKSRPLTTALINLNDLLDGLAYYAAAPEQGYGWIQSVLKQIRDMAPNDPLAVAAVKTAVHRRASVLACTHRFREKRKASSAVNL